MAQRRVTQADVAKAAGVSRSLVSRVMRGLDKVSEDKRERINRAAAELGYIDNGLATALAGNRTRQLIGFLPQDLGNDLFTDVFSGMKESLDPEHFDLVVVEGAMDPAREDARLRQLVALGPDAVVLAGYAGSQDALSAAVHALPIVSVTRPIELPGVMSVHGDDLAGARAATEYLLSLGHRRIAHVQLPPSIPYEQRARGYRQAMEEAGLDPWLVTPHVPTADAAAQALAHELDAAGERGQQGPTAVLCGSDNMALGVLEELGRRGLRVPGDVSVMGYDDQRAAGLVGLSTVDQGAREQGRIAGQLLQAALSSVRGDVPAGGAGAPGPEREARMLVPHLVPRSTTAPLR